MRKTLACALLAIVCGAATAQQTNSLFASLSLNSTSPLNVLGQAVTSAGVFTDSLITINIQAFPATPVVLLYGNYSANATVTPYNFRVDLVNEGNVYANQILLNGYTNPSPNTYTQPGTGSFSYTGAIPACTFPGGVLTCLTQTTFTKSVQAIVQDPSNAPFNIRSTGAGTLNFTNGYTNFNLSTLSGDNSTTYAFQGGFTFNFYGTTYSSCFVSANGFVSFGAQDNGFPSPTVGSVRGGVRRIMSFYEDLEPQPGATPSTFNPRIYAQMYVENGVRKVRIVHERLAEFANATGPHGGEIVLWENGDINVYVASYQVAPSISTAIGITPGNNIDPGGTGTVGQTAYGRDLSTDATLGPTFLGINRIGFELFDYTNVPVTNPMDIIGMGFNPQNPSDSGIRFIRDTSVTGAQAQYIVQL